MIRLLVNKSWNHDETSSWHLIGSNVLTPLTSECRYKLNNTLNGSKKGVVVTAGIARGTSFYHYYGVQVMAALEMNWDHS